MATSASTSSQSTVMEPKSMEYISALAAGNRAQLLADVAPAGASPATTAALAIAATITGGHLIVIRDEPRHLDESKHQLERLGLSGAASFEAGQPAEAVRRHKGLDFAVVDSNVGGCMDVLKAMDVYPRGAIVVVTDLFPEEGGGHTHRACYGHVVGKGRAMGAARRERHGSDKYW